MQTHKICKVFAICTGHMSANVQRGWQSGTFICDIELASDDICILVLAVGPRELAGRAVPEGPHLGLASHILIQVES